MTVQGCSFKSAQPRKHSLFLCLSLADMSCCLSSRPKPLFLRVETPSTIILCAYGLARQSRTPPPPLHSTPASPPPRAVNLKQTNSKTNNLTKTVLAEQRGFQRRPSGPSLLHKLRISGQPSTQTCWQPQQQQQQQTKELRPRREGRRAGTCCSCAVGGAAGLTSLMWGAQVWQDFGQPR